MPDLPLLDHVAPEVPSVGEMVNYQGGLARVVRTWETETGLHVMLRALTRIHPPATSGPSTGRCGTRSPTSNAHGVTMRRGETMAEKKTDCNCHACAGATAESGLGLALGMVVCETCGNKRCPHATNHRLACTGSNAPGQAGSLWENVPSVRRPDALD